MVSLVDSPLNVVCSCHRVEICTGLVGVSRVQLNTCNTLKNLHSQIGNTLCFLQSLGHCGNNCFVHCSFSLKEHGESIRGRDRNRNGGINRSFFVSILFIQNQCFFFNRPNFSSSGGFSFCQMRERTSTSMILKSNSNW